MLAKKTTSNDARSVENWNAAAAAFGRNSDCVFYWSRPLGAEDSVHRLTVTERGETATRISCCWALPLTASQLKQEISKCSSTRSRVSTVTLEVVGSALVCEDLWQEILAALQQELSSTLRVIRVLSGCCDRDRSMLIRSLADSIVSFQILEMTATDRYQHTFGALADERCHRLRELKIIAKGGSPTIISNREAAQLLYSILPRLERLALRGTKFETAASWCKLLEMAENHSVAAISCDAVAEDMQDYVNWNAALHSLRLLLLDRIHDSNRLQRKSSYTYNNGNTSGDERIATIEAAITVLRDWYRSTHRPAMADDHNNNNNNNNAQQRQPVDGPPPPQRSASSTSSSSC